MKTLHSCCHLVIGVLTGGAYTVPSETIKQKIDQGIGPDSKFQTDLYSTRIVHVYRDMGSNFK